MAMVRAVCRAPSAVLVRPGGTFRRLGQIASRACSSSVSTASWSSAAGSGARRLRLLEDGVFKLGEQRRNGRMVEVRNRNGNLSQTLSVRAINISGPGSMDSPLMQSMQAKIQEDLSAERVTVKDAYGDGRHVSIDVVASVFEGKSAVNRQRMVYKAIWEELQGAVHAVDQLKTRTPSEAASSPDQL